MGLYCVSAQDGALLWQVKAPPAHASPLAVDGVVYHCGSAYNAENGQLLWKTPLWRDHVSHMDPGRLYAASSYVFGGKTYIFAAVGGQELACLDLQTGKDIWTTKNTGPTIVQAVEVRVAGDVLISYGKMYKMTPAGMELAKTLVDFPGMSFGLGGVIWQDHLYQYVFAGEGFHKDSKADGLCCWDLRSGELKWAYRGPTCPWDLDYTPPIVADAKIIYAYGSGADFPRKNDSLAMYLPTPEKFTLLGSFEPGMIPWTPMAFSGGRLFLRTEAGISCYDLRAK
jgi:outer membrane protein assembly factor BamB